MCPIAYELANALKQTQIKVVRRRLYNVSEIMRLLALVILLYIFRWNFNICKVCTVRVTATVIILLWPYFEVFTDGIQSQT